MPKFLYDVDLNKNKLQNAVIQPLTTAPTNPKEGQVYYNITDKNIYRYDGEAWVTYQSELDPIEAQTLSIDSTPTSGSSNLVSSGGVYSAIQNIDALPSQSGQNGKFLTTDGTDASWATVSIPVQSVNSKTGNVVLTASDVEALPDTTDVTKWNGVSLANQIGINTGDTIYVVSLGNSTSLGAAASKYPVTRIPTAHNIPKYDANAYLISTTPAANDNSTKVATTAYVDSAVGSISVPVTSVNSKTGDVILGAADVGALADSVPAADITSDDISNWNAKSDTDEKVKTVEYSTADNTAHPIVFGNSTSATETKLASTDLYFSKSNQNNQLYSTLQIGNAANQKGRIRLNTGRGNSNEGTVLLSSATGQFKTITFPDASGTVALTTDIPSVPSWALESTKPTYTASEVGALPDSTDLSIYMQKDIDYVTAGQKSGTTLGTKATAEGSNNTASGNYSHTEGYNTTASGTYSHAEGRDTIANWDYTHAEGYGTTASGYYSHAEGGFTTASGLASHAEGLYTTAQRKSQHVFGEYNVLDTTGFVTTKGAYIEIVGNGTSTSARSNARTLDWSGNETLAGKLTLGAGPVNNMDAATKQYVDSQITTLGTVLNYKGIKATAAVLPTSGNTTGDVWIVTADSSEHVWNGSTWEEFGPTIDLSGYATLNSPAFTGTPTAPTPTASSGNTQIATKGYVDTKATITIVDWTTA